MKSGKGSLNDIISYINYFSHEDNSVLEIGCGNGDLLASISGKDKTGIDNSRECIELANHRYAGKGIKFLVMDAHEIKLTKKYDHIILSNLIESLEDIQSVFEQLKVCCHQSTKIIIHSYKPFWAPLLRLAEWLRIKQKTPIQNRMDSEDVRNLLYVSGFEVYRNTKRVLLPIFIPFLSLVFNKYLAKLPILHLFTLDHYTFAKPLEQSTADMTDYSVSIVIPARNESGNIENTIKRLPKFGRCLEMIFIEGNSTDDTWKIIQQMQRKYAAMHNIKIGQQTGKGKADAVRTGFEMASGEILMILDADLTVPPEDLPKFYNALITGKGDFINGTRLVYPMEKEAMRFLNYLGNQFFTIVFTWLLEQRFKDTLCGTKVMFRSDYMKLAKGRKYFGEFDPFGDYDLLFGAYKLNLKIVDVPVRYKERTYGVTNISRFKHGLILLKMCLFASRKCKFI